jgi:hypothetical protein
LLADKERGLSRRISTGFVKALQAVDASAPHHPPESARKQIACGLWNRKPDKTRSEFEEVVASVHTHLVCTSAETALLPSGVDSTVGKK